MRFARKLLPILLAGMVLPGELPAANEKAQPSVRPRQQFETLPLTRLRQNRLVVRAVINGQPASLMVDTGAPQSQIALHRRDHFRITGIPAGSELPAHVRVNGIFNNLAIARSFKLGSLHFADLAVIVTELRVRPGQSVRTLYDPEIDGVLGADILIPAEAILDYQQQALILNKYPQLDGNPGFDFRGFHRMPMYVSEGYNVFVQSSINGTPTRLLVDSGVFATMLHRPFVRRMRIPAQETAVRSAALNVKQDRLELARIRKFSLGSLHLIDKDVTVTDLGELTSRRSFQGSPPVVGLLGAEVLNRYNGIIDFGTRTLYLRR